MAGKTSLVYFRSRNLRGIDGSLGRFRTSAVFRVLITIAVTALADRSAGVTQKLTALTVRIEGKRFNDNLMTLAAISADDFLLG
jgi:hypothetical protein